MTRECTIIFSRQQLKIFLVLVLALLVGSCEQGAKTPELAAELFLKAMQEFRFQDAALQATSDSQSVLRAVESLTRNLDQDERQIVTGIGKGTMQIVLKEMQDSRAVVTYTLAGGVAEELSLTRQGELWKVRYQARSIFP